MITEKNENWLAERRTEINAMSDAMLEALEGTFEEANQIQNTAIIGQLGLAQAVSIVDLTLS